MKSRANSKSFGGWCAICGSSGRWVTESKFSNFRWRESRAWFPREGSFLNISSVSWTSDFCYSVTFHPRPSRP